MAKASRRAQVALASAIAVLGASGAAAAAETTAGNSLEEVVVTAQRRAERLEEVPMSVTAITAETVQRSGVVNVHDIGQIVPGAQINNLGFLTQPAIRGVSTLTAGNGFENNVAIYVDGFYSPDMVTINQDLGNVASLEVLKGPQGTLWGRNATGGAILINTAEPSKVFTGKVEVRYARFNDKTINAYVSGPITDRIRFGIAAYGRKGDGYTKMLDANGVKIGNAAPIRRASIRTKLQMDVTDDLTATLSYNFGEVHDDLGGMYTIWRYAPASLPPSPPRASQPFTIGQNRETSGIALTDEVTLKLAYQTPIGTLTSYTGYAHRRNKVNFDFDASWLDLSFTAQRWGENTFQQAIDYNITAIDKLDLVIGGSYYSDRIKDRDGLTASLGRITSTQQSTFPKEAWAGFIDGTYHVTDRLSISAGARYTTEKDGERYWSKGPTGLYTVTPNDVSTRFNAFTPRASIRYELASRTNVYASYSKGFRSGGYQTSINATTVIPFQPEKITAYEAGFKTAQSWYRFDAAAFYYDYRNLQVGLTIPLPGCTANCPPATLVNNAPKAKIYGFEASVAVQPTEHLSLRAGLLLNHARYGDFPGATGTAWNATTGLNITQTQNWGGLHMARAPDFTLNFGGEYVVPNVAGGELRLAANAAYSSKFIVQNPSLWGPLAGAALANKQRYFQPAFTVVNAQANWTDPTEHFEVGVFINNLTNKHYYLTYSGSASFGDYRQYQTPRSIGARIGYKW